MIRAVQGAQMSPPKTGRETVDLPPMHGEQEWVQGQTQGWPRVE